MQTTFLAGFFGGPFAAIAIFAINSFRLRRISRDLPAGIGMLLVVLLGMWVLHRTAPGGAALAWLEASLGSRSIRFVHQVAGLLLVGVAYLLHRREQRNSGPARSETAEWLGGGYRLHSPRHGAEYRLPGCVENVICDGLDDS